MGGCRHAARHVESTAQVATLSGDGADRLMDAKGRFLPYGRQVVEDDDVAAVAEVLRGDWLTTGPTVESFERAFSESVEAPFTIACSSGTAALHIAALAADLGPGNRAIVPTVTFLATANAVRYAGAEVVFSDVDPDTGLMRPVDLEEAFARAGGSVKAVFPVDLAGQCENLPVIHEIASRNNALVIEDACHALGTTYLRNGLTTKIGACADAAMSIFSFHAVKTVAMGEGGAVTLRDAKLAARLARLRNHGMTRDSGDFERKDLAFDSDGMPNPWYYEMPEVGFNYRASDIHSALGLSQLKKLDRFVLARRTLAKNYDEQLKPFAPLIVPLARTPDCDPAWHLYVALFDFDALGITRAQLMRALKDNGIGTQVHYMPVSRQPYYRRRYGDISLPGADRYYARCLSLPLHAGMTDADVDRVVAALRDIVGKSK